MTLRVYIYMYICICIYVSICIFAPLGFNLEDDMFKWYVSKNDFCKRLRIPIHIHIYINMYQYILYMYTYMYIYICIYKYICRFDPNYEAYKEQNNRGGVYVSSVLMSKSETKNNLKNKQLSDSSNGLKVNGKRNDNHSSLSSLSSYSSLSHKKPPMVGISLYIYICECMYISI
jgi:hypothetical protein